MSTGLEIHDLPDAPRPTKPRPKQVRTLGQVNRGDDALIDGWLVRAWFRVYGRINGSVHTRIVHEGRTSEPVYLRPDTAVMEVR